MSSWSVVDARLRSALTGESRAVTRLARAGTSVAFGTGEGGITLLLDRRPPEVSESDDAEVRIDIDPDAVAAFAAGELVLSTALLEGRARATGPVRRYLAVDPVLRGLLRAEAARGPA